MPRLKPPRGRVAAAVARAPVEPEATDVLLQVQAQEDNDSAGPDDSAPENDAASQFKEQLEALKRSEQAARDRALQAERDREDAIKRAREREAEVTQLRKQTLESQFESVSNALAAAMAEAEAAQHDIAAALEIGDAAAQAKAYRRLSKAEAAIARLEDGKTELEEQVKAPPIQEQKVNGDVLDNSPLPASAKTWLREHPEYLNNQKKNAQINLWHFEAIEEGHPAYSPGYFESIETKAGLRQAPVTRMEEVDDEPAPAPKKVVAVSAPVSREAPSVSAPRKSGKVTLSQAQKDAAKIAGISEEEYAKQVIRLMEEKSNGNYGGGQ